MASQVVKSTIVGTKVRPLLSTTKADARVRVLGLYKAWIRQATLIPIDYDVPKSEEQIKEKIRSEFLKHKHVTDIRIIDMLVIKGQMELRETASLFKHKGQIMSYWKETLEPKPTDFISKFMSGSP
ncbi:NADH dehydrogenase [ubiquinone] 1 alpha subcomplex subunit 6 [Diaphorina citri]|uniref:NADH dehydrogenase [ubiquinone] 1 alpha subcomplex subunit 6 n=1 Tax=Diaphorina citri TaxID=121845 RepID=A0A1S4E8P0_DIACI|nr:NADH dehydrogenase [ubiquinone] 1 alpha subcomplex subunit 6 [Diaphorina citri]KAI5697509.1 hypothetical protein M8J75_011552 [Diaphorina citri]KAI5719842.1 hypothetical protein M8J76_015767 [Diaphorina citri]KAI5721466.1 hypothetical protein M8J77_021153 [Diaphorina citri]